MMAAVWSRYPCSPRAMSAVQAVAMSAPERLPAKPGEMYRPPVQSVIAVYWCCRSDGQRYSTTDVPLCAMPAIRVLAGW